LTRRASRSYNLSTFCKLTFGDGVRRLRFSGWSELFGTLMTPDQYLVGSHFLRYGSGSLRPPGKGKAFFDLCDAFAVRGCAVCALVERDLTRQVDLLFGEFCNDPPTRRRLVEGGGFCERHSRLIEGCLGQCLGVALVYHDLVCSLASRLGQPTMRLPRQECPLCADQRRAEDSYLDQVLAHYDAPQLQAAYVGSFGLCLAHYERALHRCPDGAFRHRVQSQQREHLRRLERDLVEFIRKQDYRFAKEDHGEERDCWRRAVRLVRW